MPSRWLVQLTVRVMAWSQESALEGVDCMAKDANVEQVSIDKVTEEE